MEHRCAYFQTLNSVPLVFVYVLLPILYCLYYLKLCDGFCNGEMGVFPFYLTPILFYTLSY